MARKRIRRNTLRSRTRQKRAKLVGGLVLGLKIVTGVFSVTMMSGLFILSHDFLTQYDSFQIESIEIMGVQELTRDQVMEEARIRVGENILSVNLTTARKRLVAHPSIADAALRREFPSRIRIRVTEHRPLAILDLGRRFVINTQGHVYKEKTASEPETLPIVRGLALSDLNVPGQPRSVPFDAVMAVLALGREIKSAIPNQLIQRIQVDREIGLTIYTQDLIKRIRLGYDDYPSKYEQLRNVLVHLEASPDFPRLDSIDLNNPDRIVVNPSRGGWPVGKHKEV